uniref:Ig-like domain-containing protein n=1 Tax=Vombatus ursinus TaxID=29139 RepID=A0A4X2LDJ8_VOMUR
MLHSCLVTTMDTMLFWCVAICLLGVDTGVFQTPRSLLTERKKNVVLKCHPIQGHNYVYWYQQLPGQELTLLEYRDKNQVIHSSGMSKPLFSVEWTSGSPCSLKIQPVELEDSALYFCASSLTTVLQTNPSLCINLPQ